MGERSEPELTSRAWDAGHGECYSGRHMLVQPSPGLGGGVSECLDHVGRWTTPLSMSGVWDGGVGTTGSLRTPTTSGFPLSLFL